MTVFQSNAFPQELTHASYVLRVFSTELKSVLPVVVFSVFSLYPQFLFTANIFFLSTESQFQTIPMPDFSP